MIMRILFLGLVLVVSDPSVSHAQKVIVAVGDSYGSGEGAPDTAARVCAHLSGPFSSAEEFFSAAGQISCAVPAVWSANPAGVMRNGLDLSISDTACHRSGKSGAAQGVQMLRDSNAVGSVDFVSAACTGASIADLDFPSGFAGRPNGLATRANCGMGEVAAGLPDRRSAVPAQLGLVDQATATSRRIDAAVISISGNDAGFATMVSRCMFNTPGSTCVTPGNLAALLGPGSTIANRLDTLANSIDTSLRGRAANMIVLAYPDPTFDEEGRHCGPNAPGQAHRCRGRILDLADGANCNETRDMSERFIPALNKMLRDFVARQQALGRGWHFVDAHARICEQGILRRAGAPGAYVEERNGSTGSDLRCCASQRRGIQGLRGCDIGQVEGTCFTTCAGDAERLSELSAWNCLLCHSLDATPPLGAARRRQYDSGRILGNHRG